MDITKRSIILVLVILSQAYGQPPSPTNSFWPGVEWNVLNTWIDKDGLPQNSVLDIVQTDDGYLWLGTEEGLVRFDGARFTVYNKKNTDALKHNRVEALLKAKDGSLWIATGGGGLVHLRNGEFKTYSTQDGLSSNLLYSLGEGLDGSLWVRTSEGLNRLSHGHVTQFGSIDPRLERAMSRILVTHDGTVWIGTAGHGLIRYKNEEISAYTTVDGLPSNHVMSICGSRDNSLLIKTARGLVGFSDGKFRPIADRDGLLRGGVSTIYEDKDGTFLIGTSRGLVRYSNGLFQLVTTKDGLSNSSVMAIYRDHEGSLWVGTVAGGLNQLTRGKFNSYTVREGLSDNFVRSVLETKDNRLWVGTARGLNRLENGRFTTITLPSTISSEVVRSICEGYDGSLWVGLDGGGVVRSKNGRFTSLTTKDGLLSDFVNVVYESSDRVLWVGGIGGLTRVHEGRLTTYTPAGGKIRGRVFDILETMDGSLWFGTYQGLSRLKNGTFTVYTTDDGLSTNQIMSLHEDAEGNLWIGTYGGGLSRYSDGKFTSYTVKEGLFNDVVYQILEDDNENLWMSCNVGIFRVNKKELDDFDAGKIKSISCVAYGVADGMRSSECNGGQPAGIRTSDGHMWFPTLQGVVEIDPNRIWMNSVPPPVVIEQVYVDRTPTKPTNVQKLPPGRGDLQIRYTALSFVAPEKVQFKYRLEGFDQDWVDAGTRRIAYYTNIPPGQYRFRVIASNNDGVWNEKGATATFTLSPHFYQTWWFSLVCGIGVLAAFIGAFAHYRRYHERKLVASRLETHLAEARLQVLKMQLEPHFLFNTLNTISSLMRRDLEAADAMITRLGDLLRASLETSGLQVVSLKQELDLLHHYLEIERIRFGERLNITLNVLPELYDAQVPNLILQPIVENAIRYGITNETDGGTVEIRAEREDGNIRLIVSDHGPGLHDHHREGIGLSNTRNRLEQLYGPNQRFSISSDSAQGVQVTLEFPFRTVRNGLTASPGEPQ